jgi:prepilin-type N-terminal cleavage/methylation domain-containing protein
MVHHATPSRAGRTDERGYTLIEIMIVLLLIGLISSMAVPVSSYFLQQSKADSASVFASTAVDSARDVAVAQRRNVLLTFVMPNKLRVERQDINSVGVVTGTTVLNTYTLEAGQEFKLFPGQRDTPDGFGAGSATQFSGTGPYMFTSEGSLVDSNGDISNGTIFMAIPNQPETARAVTVFGVTGLTRTWKWRGQKWME